MEKRKIEVYIDGSSVDVNASVNQQNKRKRLPEVPAEWHGAYAGVFYVDGQEVMRMKGYEKGGTIGKMELSALLNAMRKVYQMNYSQVSIFGDSQYVINGATKWLKGWEKKRFKGIKFPELWREIDIMLKNSVTVYEIKWIRGHNGSAGNEIADKLANKALGAGITEWKVSGKERFLLFDKVEGFMKSPNTGDMLPIHYIHEEAGPFPVITEQMRKDADEFVKFGEKGFTTKQQIEEYKKAEPLFREQEKKLWFSDDNDFTDMAKKPIVNHNGTKLSGDPLYYEKKFEQYKKEKPIFEKTCREHDIDVLINMALDTIQEQINLIKQLQTEKDKIHGTRSTKNQDSTQ